MRNNNWMLNPHSVYEVWGGIEIDFENWGSVGINDVYHWLFVEVHCGFWWGYLFTRVQSVTAIRRRIYRDNRFFIVSKARNSCLIIPFQFHIDLVSPFPITRLSFSFKFNLLNCFWKLPRRYRSIDNLQEYYCKEIHVKYWTYVRSAKSQIGFSVTSTYYLSDCSEQNAFRRECLSRLAIVHCSQFEIPLEQPSTHLFFSLSGSSISKLIAKRALRMYRREKWRRNGRNVERRREAGGGGDLSFSSSLLSACSPLQFSYWGHGKWGKNETETERGGSFLIPDPFFLGRRWGKSETLTLSFLNALSVVEESR